MSEYELTGGEGRTRVNLAASNLGNDLTVIISNEMGHIGAVAVGEYDYETERASVSVLTRRGHKDDAVAQQAAYRISKATRKPVCVIAGIHLDDITPEEIKACVVNAMLAVDELINRLQSG